MKKLTLLIAILIPLFAQSQAVEKIRLRVNRQAGYIEISATFKLQLTVAQASNPQIKPILKSYTNQFNFIRLDTIASVTYAVVSVPTVSVSITTNPTAATIQTAILNRYNAMQTTITNFVIQGFDNIIGQSYIGTSWVTSPQIDSL